MLYAVESNSKSELVRLEKLVLNLKNNIKREAPINPPEKIETFSDVLKSLCSGNKKPAIEFLESKKRKILERPYLPIFPVIDYLLFERKDPEVAKLVFNKLKETRDAEPHTFNETDKLLLKLYEIVFDFIKSNKSNKTLTEEEKRERIKQLIEMIDKIDIDGVDDDLPKLVKEILKVRVGLNSISGLRSVSVRTFSIEQIDPEIIEGYNIPYIEPIQDVVTDYFMAVRDKIIIDKKLFSACETVKSRVKDINDKIEKFPDNPPFWAKIVATIIILVSLIFSIYMIYHRIYPFITKKLTTFGINLHPVLIAVSIIIILLLSLYKLATAPWKKLFKFIAKVRYIVDKKYWEAMEKKLCIDVEVCDILFK